MTTRPKLAPAVLSRPWGLLLLVIALLVTSVLLVACGRGDGAKADEGETKPAGEEAAEAPKGPYELASGDVAVVRRESLTRQLAISGTLAPLVQVTVKAKVGGEVLALTVREGERVQRGDVLARLDTRNQQAVVAAQRAAVAKARADAAVSQLTYESNERLREKGFIAQTVVDTSKGVYEASRAGVQLAQSQLDLAAIGLSDAVVRAPIDGVVARRAVEPGEKVAPDAVLVQIVDLSRMELRAAVPAAEVAAIEAGQTAAVRVDGMPDTAFTGTVERINPTSEQGSRSILLYLSVANPEGRLRGGMFALGTLTLARTQPVLAVPAAAVRREAGQASVTLVAGGKLLSRPVQLGLATADAAMVEVRAGLVEGDTVLVTRLDTLKPGTAVTVVGSPTPAVVKPAAIPAATPTTVTQ